MKNIEFRPLGKVRELVQMTGIDISYAYDDLVFSEHSVFIIRFDETSKTLLHLYFNEECNPREAEIMKKRLAVAAKMEGFDLVNRGKYIIDQIEGKEELEINFLELVR
jgi:hypothetical protein